MSLLRRSHGGGRDFLQENKMNVSRMETNNRCLAAANARRVPLWRPVVLHYSEKRRPHFHNNNQRRPRPVNLHSESNDMRSGLAQPYGFQTNQRRRMPPSACGCDLTKGQEVRKEQERLQGGWQDQQKEKPAKKCCHGCHCHQNQQSYPISPHQGHQIAAVSPHQGYQNGAVSPHQGYQSEAKDKPISPHQGYHNETVSPHQDHQMEGMNNKNVAEAIPSKRYTSSHHQNGLVSSHQGRQSGGVSPHQGHQNGAVSPHQGHQSEAKVNPNEPDAIASKRSRADQLDSISICSRMSRASLRSQRNPTESQENKDPEAPLSARSRASAATLKSKRSISQESVRSNATIKSNVTVASRSTAASKRSAVSRKSQMMEVMPPPTHLQDQREKQQVPQQTAYEGYTPLTENERSAALQDAHFKYGKLVEEYNHLPVSEPTLRVRNRKIAIERQLDELDYAINMFDQPHLEMYYKK